MFGQNTPATWFFESSGNIEAVNRLLYVIDKRESVGLLTGCHGVGKTTILRKLTSEIQAFGLSAVLLNLAGMDDDSALFQLADRVSEQTRNAMNRRELVSCLRTEFSGRARCGIQTLILLDDVHLADSPKESFLRILVSLAVSTRGLTIIGCGEDCMPEILSQCATVPVVLTRLSINESTEFLRQLLPRLGCPNGVLAEAVIQIAVDLCCGRLQALCRFGEVISVFHRAWPSVPITSSTVRQLATECGLQSQDANLNHRVLKFA